MKRPVAFSAYKRIWPLFTNITRLRPWFRKETSPITNSSGWYFAATCAYFKPIVAIWGLVNTTPITLRRKPPSIFGKIAALWPAILPWSEASCSRGNWLDASPAMKMCGMLVCMVSGSATGTPRASFSIVRFSKPILSTFGRRPAAAKTYSAWNTPFSPSCSQWTSTLPSASNLTSVLASKCRVNSSPKTVLASSATTGSEIPPIAPATPKISTFTPKRCKAWPNSKPITPGPNTATLLGRVSQEKTSSLTIKRSPKTSHWGKITGREPVAITKLFAVIWVWSSIWTVCSSTNFAVPITRLSAGHSSTSLTTKPTKRSRSDFTRCMTSSPFTVTLSLSKCTPNGSVCRAWWRASAAAISNLDGIQPTRAQVVPNTLFSIR